MKLEVSRHEDISHLISTDEFKMTHEVNFNQSIETWPATLEDEASDNEEQFDTLAIETLEQHLGYRFDEDSWYTFDWRDDCTVWIRYNEPYAARRLPL